MTIISLRKAFCASSHVNGTTTYGCMCLNGGDYPLQCCPKACSLGEMCFQGNCECMYMKKPGGSQCTLCQEVCDPDFSECDENGEYFMYKKRCSTLK